MKRDVIKVILCLVAIVGILVLGSRIDDLKAENAALEATVTAQAEMIEALESTIRVQAYPPPMAYPAPGVTP